MLCGRRSRNSSLPDDRRFPRRGPSGRVTDRDPLDQVEYRVGPRSCEVPLKLVVPGR